MCSTSNATDNKKRYEEWVGMEQPSFDTKHQFKQRDVSNIAPYPSPSYHMLKRLTQHRFKWYSGMREYS